MNYTKISGGDLVYVSFRRQYTSLQVQGLGPRGSDGLLTSENPLFVFSLLLPVSLDHSPHWLSGPLGVSQGSVKVLAWV